jgi:hypothetical protein
VGTAQQLGISLALVMREICTQGLALPPPITVRFPFELQQRKAVVIRRERLYDLFAHVYNQRLPEENRDEVFLIVTLITYQNRQLSKW